jgi:hypothetical protein
VRLVDGLLHPGDVAAGAEGAAGAGEDDDVGFVVVARIDKDTRQLGVQLGVRRVELRRAVERQRQDAPAPFGQYGLVAVIPADRRALPLARSPSFPPCGRREGEGDART